MSIRNLQDALLTVSKALPAAAASASTDPIFLGESGPDRDTIEFRLSMPATPSLVDDKTITLTIEDSADGVNFTAVSALATLVITGAGGNGGAAATRDIKLPTGARSYIRATAAVLTAGGNNTAVSFTLTPLF